MTFYNHERKLCHPRRWVCHTSSKLQVSRVRKEFWRWSSAPALDCQTRPRNRIYLVVQNHNIRGSDLLGALGQISTSKVWSCVEKYCNTRWPWQCSIKKCCHSCWQLCCHPWHTSSMDRRTCKDTEPANSPILHSGCCREFFNVKKNWFGNEILILELSPTSLLE